MSDKLKIAIQKSHDYDDLVIHTKGFMFDSLVYRFKDYQAKAFQSEVTDYKYIYNVSEIEARKEIQDRHNRDLMRFICILNEAIGEHD